MHAAESRIIPFFVKRRREEERILRFCAVPPNSKFSDLKIGAGRPVQRQRPTTQWRKVSIKDTSMFVSVLVKLNQNGGSAV